MSAVGRPPSFGVWVLSPVVFLFLVVGPVGKWETRASSRFPLFHQGGSPFFFAPFFFANNPHFLRLFRKFGSSALAACALLGCLGTVAVDGQFEDHRVMDDAIDCGSRGHGVFEDL